MSGIVSAKVVARAAAKADGIAIAGGIGIVADGIATVDAIRLQFRQRLCSRQLRPKRPSSRKKSRTTTSRLSSKVRTRRCRIRAELKWLARMRLQAPMDRVVRIAKVADVETGVDVGIGVVTGIAVAMVHPGFRFQLP